MNAMAADSKAHDTHGHLVSSEAPSSEPALTSSMNALELRSHSLVNELCVSRGVLHDDERKGQRELHALKEQRERQEEKTWQARKVFADMKCKELREFCEVQHEKTSKKLAESFAAAAELQTRKIRAEGEAYRRELRELARRLEEENEQHMERLAWEMSAYFERELKRINRELIEDVGRDLEREFGRWARARDELREEYETR